jgi:hypothetical protein
LFAEIKRGAAYFSFGIAITFVSETVALGMSFDTALLIVKWKLLIFQKTFGVVCLLR